MKKYILVLILVVIVVAGALVWWFFMRGDGVENNPNQNTPTSTAPNVNPEEKSSVINQEPTAAYFPDESGEIIVINQNGKINKISENGVEIISEEEVKDLVGATFSYDGKKILASLGDKNNPTTSVFDLKQKSWRPLKDVSWPASWSPADYRLAYFTNTKTGQSLQTIDLGNIKATPKKIIDTNSADLIPNWVYPTTIILEEKSSAYTATSIWAVDLRNNTISAVMRDRLGLQGEWDKLNKYGIISANNNTITERLSLIDLSGKVLRKFNFLTLPEKCAFETENTTSTQAARTDKLIYCAIPRGGQKLGTKILPDDYWQGAVFTNDEILKIDLQLGNVVLIKMPEKGSFDVTNMNVKNEFLYFINRLDGLLHRVSTI